MPGELTIPRFLRDTSWAVGRHALDRKGRTVGTVLCAPRLDLASGKWHAFAEVGGAVVRVELSIRFRERSK